MNNRQRILDISIDPRTVSEHIASIQYLAKTHEFESLLADKLADKNNIVAQYFEADRQIMINSLDIVLIYMNQKQDELREIYRLHEIRQASSSASSGLFGLSRRRNINLRVDIESSNVRNMAPTPPK